MGCSRHRHHAFIESIWSLAVMIDRYLYFSAARKQSREFAPKVAGALKDSKLEEAIKIADRNKKSHLPRSSRLVCKSSALLVAPLPRRPSRAPAVRWRGLRPSSRQTEEGLSVLATIGATAPFVDCSAPSSAFCTPFSRSPLRRLRHRRSCRRHLGSLGHHRLRVTGRHPRRHDLQLLHRSCREFRRGDG